MSVIPCDQSDELKKKIEEFAEILKTESHKLGMHGMTELEFYQSGIFEGAIERIRGQQSATMRVKRAFMDLIFAHMEDNGFIRSWSSSGNSNRHDYTVILPNGKISVVESKGCLDGNNTTIFSRPTNAQEFILWSLCPSKSSDTNKNVWSGIHTRLSAEIIEKEVVVDGLVVWDWFCGTPDRPCPKIATDNTRRTIIGQYQLPPPCIYLFPGTVPSVRNNPNPAPHSLNEVGLLEALHKCFNGKDEELNYVNIGVAYHGTDVVRTTSIMRNSITQRTSNATAIRRR
jgi:hypothetical protein